MAGDILDARDRFRAEGNPTAVLMDPADVADLQRLRELERTLQRPIVELAAELTALRVVAQEAVTAMDKVDEHERVGYARIRLGAFTKLRAALKLVPR